MGIEHDLLPNCRAAFDGKPLPKPIMNPYARGLSPNHKAMAIANAYHQGFATGVSSASVVKWFDEQAEVFGHCANETYSEQMSQIYVPGFWSIGVAVLTRTSFRRKDTAVYRRCLRWWHSTLYLWSLAQVDNGIPAVVGCRIGDPRDARAAQIFALAVRGKERFSWRAQYDEQYYWGPGMVRDLVDAGELGRVVVTHDDRPRIWNKMEVRRNANSNTLLIDYLDRCHGGPVWAVEIKDGKLVAEVSWRSEGKSWKQAKRGGGGETPPHLLSLSPLVYTLSMSTPVPRLPPAPWSDEPAEPGPEPEPPVVDGARRVVGKLYDDGTYDLEEG